MATNAAPKQFPKFSWDYDVPETPFWADLPFTTARNFLSCYSAQELDAMAFPDDLVKDSKWRLLLSRLEEKLKITEAAHAPTPLYDADYKSWNVIKLGIYTMHRELGDLDKATALLEEMHQHGTYNGKMSAKNMLAEIKGEAGQYAEAEALGKECLTWLREMDVLGPDSPQALGCQRRLMAVVWKQGKHEQARQIEKEMAALIEGMTGGKFEKYQEEERQMLKDMMTGLEEWTPECEAQ